MRQWWHQNRWFLACWTTMTLILFVGSNISMDFFAFFDVQRITKKVSGIILYIFIFKGVLFLSLSLSLSLSTAPLSFSSFVSFFFSQRWSQGEAVLESLDWCIKNIQIMTRWIGKLEGINHPHVAGGKWAGSTGSSSLGLERSSHFQEVKILGSFWLKKF